MAREPLALYECARAIYGSDPARDRLHEALVAHGLTTVPVMSNSHSHHVPTNMGSSAFSDNLANRTMENQGHQIDHKDSGCCSPGSLTPRVGKQPVQMGCQDSQCACLSLTGMECITSNPMGAHQWACPP